MAAMPFICSLLLMEHYLPFARQPAECV